LLHTQITPRSAAATRAAAPHRRAAGARVSAVIAQNAPASTGEGCPRGAQWIVHKFGGTCMASAERITGASRLIIDDPAEGKVVVVSAMGSTKESPLKVTDLILNMVSKAAKQDNAFLVDLASLQEKHVAAAKELLGEGPRLSAFIARLLEDIGNLKAMLQAICIGEHSAACAWAAERSMPATWRGRRGRQEQSHALVNRAEVVACWSSMGSCMHHAACSVQHHLNEPHPPPPTPCQRSRHPDRGLC